MDATDRKIKSAVYAHHVSKGTGSFETEPPSAADMASRRAYALSKGPPCLVAEFGAWREIVIMQ